MGNRKVDSPRKQADAQMRAFIRNFPELAQVISQEVPTLAQAEVEGARVTSPQFAELEAEIMREFGPELTSAGLDLERQRRLGEADIDADVLSGPGRRLLGETREAAGELDPEFMALRPQISEGFQNLIGSIDPSGALDPTVAAEVERSIARNQAQRGTLDVPTATGVATAGMQFGRAGQQQQFQRQQMLQQALSGATQAAQGLRLGLDPVQAALGRPAQAVMGTQFPQITPGGQQAVGLGQGAFQDIGATTRQHAQIRSRQPSVFDRVRGGFETFGAPVLGGLAEMGAPGVGSIFGR